MSAPTKLEAEPLRAGSTVARSLATAQAYRREYPYLWHPMTGQAIHD
jgi:hypothetical protein